MIPLVFNTQAHLVSPWVVCIIQQQHTAHLEHRLRELEVDLLAGELLVDAGEGVSLVLDVGLLGLVQVDLEQTRTVQADPVTMATVKT